jgi:hypothetical protein
LAGNKNCFFSAIQGMGICGDCFPQGNLFFVLPMVRIKLHSQQANVQLFHKYTLRKILVFDDLIGQECELGGWGSSSMSNFWASLCMPVLSSRHLFKRLKRKEVINVCKRKIKNVIENHLRLKPSGVSEKVL